MEIQNNLSNANNIIVSKPSRENLGDDEKTGLERVSEAIEQGRQMREAISGDDEDDKKESSAGSGGKSELAKSIEKMKKAILFCLILCVLYMAMALSLSASEIF